MKVQWKKGRPQKPGDYAICKIDGSISAAKLEYRQQVEGKGTYLALIENDSIKNAEKKDDVLSIVYYFQLPLLPRKE